MTKFKVVFPAAIGIIVVAVGGFVGHYVGLEQGFQAGLTAALVLVTATYVYLTSEIVRETKEQRQSAFMPILIAQCSSRMPDTLEVALQNIGPGPALDIGLTVIDGLPNQVENAWKQGKTAGMGSILASFSLPELASGWDTGGNPKQLSLTLTEAQKFLIVIECGDVNKNTIGSYRGFRVLKVEQGKWKIEATQTVSPQRIKYRTRSYP